MKSFTIVLAISSACAAFDLAFVGNVSGVSANVDLQFRAAGLLQLDVPLVHHGAVTHSLDARIAADVLNNRDIAKVGAEVQGLWGYGGVTVGSAPSAWLGVFNANARVGVGLRDIASVDVHGALGFMGLTYTSLVERDQSGNIVSRQSLAFGGARSALTWVSDDHGTSRRAPGTSFYRLVGTRSPLTVTITFVVSSVSGVLDYGKTTVVPKVLESVIEINNYPYQDHRNTLEVHMVAGSSGLSVGAHAAVTTSGVKVFAGVKGTAIVNGNEANAEVSAWANADAMALNNTALANLIAGATGVVSVNDIKCAEVTVKFEAGAQVIVYDPALGTGTSPYELPTDGSMYPMDSDPAAPNAIPMALVLLALVFLVAL
eukprot:m51a1_g7684 putative C-tail anchored protein (373) ;mRNA; f:23290-24596